MIDRLLRKKAFINKWNFLTVLLWKALHCFHTLYILYLSFFFFMVVFGFELRASYLQSRCSNACAIPPVAFSLVVLEMRSCELFAWAALEL
jgi:hypothetical protein